MGIFQRWKAYHVLVVGEVHCGELQTRQLRRKRAYSTPGITAYGLGNCVGKISAAHLSTLLHMAPRQWQSVISFRQEVHVLAACPSAQRTAAHL